MGPRIGLLLLGLLLGVVMLAPVTAHVGSPSHNWDKHYKPLAKKSFFTKGQAKKRFLEEGACEDGQIWASGLVPDPDSSTYIDLDGYSCRGTFRAKELQSGVHRVDLGYRTLGNSCPSLVVGITIQGSDSFVDGRFAEARTVLEGVSVVKRCVLHVEIFEDDGTLSNGQYFLQWSGIA